MELFAADGHDASGCERVTGKSGMRPYVILSEFLMPTPGSEPLQYAGLDGMAEFAAGMRAHGFTDRDLDLMFKENPARLLGLGPVQK